MLVDHLLYLLGVEHLRIILRVLARADVLRIVESRRLHPVSCRHDVLCERDIRDFGVISSLIGLSENYVHSKAQVRLTRVRCNSGKERLGLKRCLRHQHI
jgi:hypothetical protein